MSFMFHPYPYADPNAVNPINAPESVKKGLVKGPQAVAKEIARQIKAGKTRVGIDCYAGAEIGALARQLEEFVENAESYCFPSFSPVSIACSCAVSALHWPG